MPHFGNIIFIVITFDPIYHSIENNADGEDISSKGIVSNFKFKLEVKIKFEKNLSPRSISGA